MVRLQQIRRKEFTNTVKQAFAKLKLQKFLTRQAMHGEKISIENLQNLLTKQRLKVEKNSLDFELYTSSRSTPVFRL